MYQKCKGVIANVWLHISLTLCNGKITFENIFNLLLISGVTRGHPARAD